LYPIDICKRLELSGWGDGGKRGDNLAKKISREYIVFKVDFEKA